MLSVEKLLVPGWDMHLFYPKLLLIVFCTLLMKDTQVESVFVHVFPRNGAIYWPFIIPLIVVNHIVAGN